MAEIHHSLMLEAFEAGLIACSPRRAMAGILPKTPPKGRTLILGAGKAAAEMARIALEQVTGPVSGIVVTRYGYEQLEPIDGVRVLLAGHPTPDTASLEAADAILELARSATEDDRVIFLISGGGSALLCKPLEGLSLEVKQRINRRLVGSGVPIEDINHVRKHLSQIKGGRLSEAAAMADQYTYILSDVVGDDPAHIASGPTVPVDWDPERAILIMTATGYEPNDELAMLMNSTPPAAPKSHNTKVLATGDDALGAVEAHISKAGWTVVNLGASIEGEARHIGASHAALVRKHLASRKRLAIISGGELTVTVAEPSGRGGPNLEYLAGLISHLPVDAAFSALACDSDGIDGTEDSAGALVDGHTLRRMNEVGVDLTSHLGRNDTYPMFDAIGALIKTGPTQTNVNDIRIILVN